MSNLRHAPPWLDDDDDDHWVFIDISSAKYDIVFDLRSQSVTVTSTLDFVTEQTGKPLLDLQCPPDRVSSVRLTSGPRRRRAKVKTVSIPQDPGLPDATLLGLCRSLKPGKHTLVMKHKLHRDRHDSDSGAFLRWRRNGVQCVFQMSDLLINGSTRGFLGSYLPANLEYDQFEISMDVRIKGAKRKGLEDHALVTNGETRRRGRKKWSVSYPKTFTSSFPWFHLVPRKSIVERWFTAGDSLALVHLYAMKTNSTANELANFEAGVKQAVRELELNIDKFPYSRIVVFASSVISGRGMEYAGATATSFDVLRHELEHSYFARCVAPADGNAGWVDEAIAGWGDYGYYERREEPHLTASDHASRGLGGHSPYRRVTDHRATRIGAELMAHIEYLLDKWGVPDALKGFLPVYYRHNRNEVVTSRTFEKQLIKYVGKHAKKRRKKRRARLKKLFERYVNRQTLLLDGYDPLECDECAAQLGSIGVHSSSPHSLERRWTVDDLSQVLDW